MTVGFEAISSGVPVAITLPKLSTTMRSQVLEDHADVVLDEQDGQAVGGERADQLEELLASTWFIPAAGSSRMSRVGSDASARAISRRRWSP